MDNLEDDQVEPRDSSLQEEIFGLPLKRADSSQFDALLSLENERDCANGVTNSTHKESRFICSLHVTLRSASIYRKLLQEKLAIAENRTEKIIPNPKKIGTETPSNAKYGGLNGTPKKDSQGEVQSPLHDEQFFAHQSNALNLQIRGRTTEDDLNRTVIMQAKTTVDDAAENLQPYRNEFDAGLRSTFQALCRETELPEEKFSLVKELSPTFEATELAPLEFYFDNAAITWHEEGMENLQKEIFLADSTTATVRCSEKSDIKVQEETHEKISQEEELEHDDHIYDVVADDEDDRYLYEDDEHIYETVADEDDVCQELSYLEQTRYEDTSFGVLSEDEPQPTIEKFLEFPSETSLAGAENYIEDNFDNQDNIQHDGPYENIVVLAPQNQMSLEPRERSILSDVESSFMPKAKADNEEDAVNAENSEDLGYVRLTVKQRVLQKEKELKELQERETEIRERPKRLSESAKSKRRTVPIAEVFRKLRQRQEHKGETSSTSPSTMRRSGSPPVMSPSRRSPLAALNHKPTDIRETTFNESEEAEYEQMEEEKAATAATLYSPGHIPQISINLIEDPPPDDDDEHIYETIRGNTQAENQKNGDAATSESNIMHSFIMEAVERPSTLPAELNSTAKDVSAKKDEEPEEKSFDLNVYDDSDYAVNQTEPIKWDEGCSSLVIKMMSRTNKWIPLDEEDEAVRKRQEAFRNRKFPFVTANEYEKPRVHKVMPVTTEERTAVTKEVPLRNELETPPLARPSEVSLEKFSTRPLVTPLDERVSSPDYSRPSTPDSIKSPPHSYTGPITPRKEKKTRPSPHHHYVPLLHQNFNKPQETFSEKSVTRPVTSSTSPLHEAVKSTEFVPSEKQSLSPIQSVKFTTLLSPVQPDKASTPPSIPAVLEHQSFPPEQLDKITSPSPTANDASPSTPTDLTAGVVSPSIAATSPSGDRARTFPQVNKQPYVPRVLRVAKRDLPADQGVLQPSTATLDAESESVPVVQAENTHSVASLSLIQDQPSTAAGSYQPTQSLSRPVPLPAAEPFVPVHRYTGIELPKNPLVRTFTPVAPKRSPALRWASSEENFSAQKQPAVQSVQYPVRNIQPHSPKEVPLPSPSQSPVKARFAYIEASADPKEVQSPEAAENQIVEGVQKVELTGSSNDTDPYKFEEKTSSADLSSPNKSLRSPLGDYYRVFQPAAYRSPERDFIHSEAKAQQEASSPPPPEKPIPVAVDGDTARKLIFKKANSFPPDILNNEDNAEASPEFLNREQELKEIPVSEGTISTGHVETSEGASVAFHSSSSTNQTSKDVGSKTPVTTVRKYPPVQTTPVAYNPLRKMPAIERSSAAQFVKEGSLDKLNVEDSPSIAQWDPQLLIAKLYEINYNPRKESKRNRFTNMEGHLDVPINDQNLIAELQKTWTQKYFRTKEGRLQWFATHFADDHPVGEVLLSGCEVDANREEGLLAIHGGRDHVKMVVRVPPTTNLFDKWRKALNSHAASSYMDAFVHPVAPPLPHISEKVAVIELGSCSIRAGILTMEPSLPQSFFPNIALVKENGDVIVGGEALSPENRHSGELIRPIQATDPSLERYTIHQPALKACLQKCIGDLKIDPKKYRVMLSIPQNIPTVLIADILKISLQELHFQGVAISRQPSLILYAYDVTTGVVVDIGDQLSIVPVIDGYVVDNAVVSLPYGAIQITNALQSKLAESNMGLYISRSPVERLILRYVMEQSCYIAIDFDEEVKRCTNGNEVDKIVSLDEFKPTSEMRGIFKVNSARFTAPEGLFKPKRWGLDTKALHQLVYEAVQLSPIDSRKTLFRNIYLAGGASLLPGLAERLEIELSSLVASTIHTQVHMSPWRYNAAYLGAQVVASSTHFDRTCVTLDSLDQFMVQLQNSTF